MKKVDKIEMVARVFQQKIHEVLTTEELIKIDKANKINDEHSMGTCCATHDYCDANVYMIDAFREVIGRYAIAASDHDMGITNDAWDRAKEIGFATIQEKQPILEDTLAIESCMRMLTPDPLTARMQCQGIRCIECPGSTYYNKDSIPCTENGWSIDGTARQNNMTVKASAQLFLAKKYIDLRQNNLVKLVCDIWGIDELAIEDGVYKIAEGCEAELGTTYMECAASTLEIQKDILENENSLPCEVVELEKLVEELDSTYQLILKIEEVI